MRLELPLIRRCKALAIEKYFSIYIEIYSAHVLLAQARACDVIIDRCRVQKKLLDSTINEAKTLYQRSAYCLPCLELLVTSDNVDAVNTKKLLS